MEIGESVFELLSDVWTTDGRTDGRTDGQRYTIIRPV